MKILICEDDRRLNSLISRLISDAGFEVQSCYTIEQLEYEMSRSVDLFLLDVHLGSANTFEILRRIRQDLHAPVLLLSADLEEASILEGYRLDADEYIEKPVRPAVLMAKIRAAIRRNGLCSEPIRKQGWIFDPGQKTLTNENKDLLKDPIQLSRSQSQLFRRLFAAFPSAVSKEVLKSSLSDECSDNTLRYRLSELRNQLDGLMKVESLRQEGYRLRIEVPDE